MIATPHDALFKAVFSDVVRAAEELRYALGPEVAGSIDFSTLTLEAGNFVDEALRERHADILYSAALAGHKVMIYVLLEHQSSDDPWMSLRLLMYMVRVWESLLRAEPRPQRLPAILPVVLHHSEKGWRSSTHFGALIDLPEGAPAAVWAHVPDFRFALDDLAATSAEALNRRAVSACTRITLSALQQTRTVMDVAELVGGWVKTLLELRGEPDGARALRLVFRYIAEVRGLDDRKIIDILATEVGKQEAEIMQTLADWWRHEGELKGRQEGRQEGEREGERNLLLKQLLRRFGELPGGVRARVEGADVAKLEDWGEALLDARSLEDLFGPA